MTRIITLLTALAALLATSAAIAETAGVDIGKAGLIDAHSNFIVK